MSKATTMRPATAASKQCHYRFDESICNRIWTRGRRTCFLGLTRHCRSTVWKYSSWAIPSQVIGGTSFLTPSLQKFIPMPPPILFDHLWVHTTSPSVRSFFPTLARRLSFRFWERHTGSVSFTTESSSSYDWALKLHVCVRFSRNLVFFSYFSIIKFLRQNNSFHTTRF